MKAMNGVWGVYRRYGAAVARVKDNAPTDSRPIPREKPFISNRFEVIRWLARTPGSVIFLVLDKKTRQLAIAKGRGLQGDDRRLIFEKQVLEKNIAGLPSLLAFVQNDEPFIIMTKIAGVELKQYLDNKRGLPLWQALDITHQLLAQLAALHKEDFVHRDIKPTNIMIDHVGKIQLFDFDISCVINTNTQGKPVGTPEYMPPEQSRGCGVSARSDIYSAGLILYEMIVGDNPMQGTTLAAKYNNQRYNILSDSKLWEIRRKLLGQINDVQQKVFEKFIEELNKLIQKMTAKKPENRFQSAHEALNDLEEIMKLWEPLAPFEKCWPRVDGGGGRIGLIKQDILVGGWEDSAKGRSVNS